MLSRHVASALDLEQRADEARHYSPSPFFELVVAQATEWQMLMMQHVIDLIVCGTADEELPPNVDARDSYLDSSLPGIAGTQADTGAIQKALIAISQQTLLDMDGKDPNTADILGQISKAASHASQSV